MEQAALSGPRSRLWIATLAASLLFHLLLLIAPTPEWLLGPADVSKKRMPVQTLSSDQLNQLKKKWSDKKERQLILSADPKPKSDTEAPPDARFASDRNRSVPKEVRARQVAPLPQLKAPARVSPRTSQRSAPLSALGVPLKLDGRPLTQPQESSESAALSPSAQPAGDVWVDDPSLPLGDQNLLNTQESKYYSFYARVYEQIAPNWTRKIREASAWVRVGAAEYIALVDATLDREGNLVDLTFIQSSGVPEFDQAVVDSWKRAARFPNPPKDLLDAAGRIHLQWKYTVDASASGGLRFNPPRKVRPY